MTGGSELGYAWVDIPPNHAREPSMQLESTITCPNCLHQAIEQMPTNACQFFYICRGCGQKLKPLAGDCCVFCSYGSVPCPPVQENGKSACCGQRVQNPLPTCSG
jgi:hypothetical protein